MNASDHRETNRSSVWQYAARFQSLLVLVLMVLAISLLSDRFLTAANGWNIMRQISVNMCLSIGMTLVILSGGIDLSVGSVLALTGAIAAGLIKFPIPVPWLPYEIQFTTWVPLLQRSSWHRAGLVQWADDTRVKIPPFVATLGMLSIARGLTMLWTKGFPITGLGDEFAMLGTRNLLGVPTPVWIAVSLVLLFTLLTKKTRLGRYIYAIGGNEQTARLSGLNVNRIKVIVYTLAGGLSAVAGLITTSRLDSAQTKRRHRIRAGQHRRCRYRRYVALRRSRLDRRHGHRLHDHRSIEQWLSTTGRFTVLATSHQGAVILVAVAIDRMRETGE